MRIPFLAAIFVLTFASLGFGQTPTCATGQCPMPPPKVMPAPQGYAPPQIYAVPQAYPQAVVVQSHTVAYSGHRGWYPGRFLGRIFCCH